MLTRPPPQMEGGYSPMNRPSLQDLFSVRPAQSSETLSVKPLRPARVLTEAYRCFRVAMRVCKFTRRISVAGIAEGIL